MFDFEKLDKTIHEKGRLGIMTLLATRPSWSFQDLKAELGLSDGNLVTHLRTLHDAGLVAVTKEANISPCSNRSSTQGSRADDPPHHSRTDSSTRASAGLRRFLRTRCSNPSTCPYALSHKVN